MIITKSESYNTLLNVCIHIHSIFLLYSTTENWLCLLEFLTLTEPHSWEISVTPRKIIYWNEYSPYKFSTKEKYYFFIVLQWVCPSFILLATVLFFLKKKYIKGKGLENNNKQIFWKGKTVPWWLLEFSHMQRDCLCTVETAGWLSLHLTKKHDGRHQEQLPRRSCGWWFLLGNSSWESDSTSLQATECHMIGYFPGPTQKTLKPRVTFCPLPTDPPSHSHHAWASEPSLFEVKYAKTLPGHIFLTQELEPGTHFWTLEETFLWFSPAFLAGSV